MHTTCSGRQLCRLKENGEKYSHWKKEIKAVLEFKLIMEKSTRDFGEPTQ